MNVADAALRVLWQQTQLLCLAMAVVVLLRPLLRRAFGVQVAYLVWCAVPLMCGAALLPAPALVPLSPVAWVVDGGGLQRWPMALESALPVALWVTAAHCAAVVWLAGVVLTVACMAVQQARATKLLKRGVGVPHWQLPAGSSPALVGAWRPRLALPEDFTQRFDAEEQQAILAHEAAHLRRHDNRWNLLAHALAALHWFNPLAWWALRRMRADQELACDAAVLVQAGAPTATLYAHALLKSQHLTALLPAATRWHSTHPFVERIAMLQHHHRLSHHRYSPARRHAGRFVAAALGLLCLGAGQALQAGQPPAESLPGKVMVSIQADFDGVPFSSPRLLGDMGKPMAVAWGPDAAAGRAEPWRLELTTTRQGADRLQLDTRLSAGEPLQLLAQPRLVTPAGERARMEVRSADGLHVLGISVVARLVAPTDPLPAPR